MYRISNDIQNEITINKSRFITLLYQVYNEKDALDIITKVKKEYKDATHYCYSYIIDNVKRFNDDGEPGGTAGIPILNVLENNELNYIVAVVVRYFGGIKLGAGGLVRAYSKSIAECLEKMDLEEIEYGKSIDIYFNYDKVKFIDNLLKNYKITNKVFNEDIVYSINISNKDFLIIKEILNSNNIKFNISNDSIII